MRMFAEEPEVIELGARFLRLISLMYFLPALTNGIQGFFRGIGDLKITLRSSMLSMAARVPSAALLVLYFHMEIEALPWSYAFGWFLMLAYEVPPMLRFCAAARWKETNKIARASSLPGREEGPALLFCALSSK